MKIILAGILLLVALTNADQPCQVPRRFTGNFIGFAYNSDADKFDATYNGKMYYDGVNRRTRVEGQNKGQKYVVINLYEEREQYVITGGHCFAMSVNGTFQDMSIPANASLVNGGRIGTSSNGLFIDRYFGEKDGAKGIMTVTQEGCVITSSVALSEKDGAKLINYFSFTEVSLEYEDSVFDKPEDCHNIGGSRARRSTGGILDNLQEVIDLY